ncbi:M28 family metallopeptidase [Aureibacter tunicatorum]|uniref:Peptidase M28 domain-containing protein n=1 Tax=Aureibacter tunicatorum TaxID=866807 RepID=A0AAE4BQV3_9BACT|nr:M28 family metallopeptidase [Aureibacter tunicatorum]MDR6239574.1 hypothetical protein [Aureibacter tunicatorum]BDD04051.1 hypothetical protein AUTU_15340 [Aureibacter tunicatorum]
MDRLKRKAVLFFWILFVVSVSSYAQQPDSLLLDSLRVEGKVLVKTLSSDLFWGRGYVNRGDSIAADYILSEFDSARLDTVYAHTYTHNVNVFPDTVELAINGQPLRAGVSFLVEPWSPSIKGDFEVQYISIQDFLDDSVWGGKIRDAKDKAIVIDKKEMEGLDPEEIKKLKDIFDYLRFHEDNPAKLTIFLTDEKLTWSVSQKVMGKPTIVLKTNLTGDKLKKVSVHINAELIQNYEARNIVSQFNSAKSDSLIVFTAHYDHLGMMGLDAFFPGANDNASGTSMLISMARRLGMISRDSLDYSVAFIAFGGEELGLVGSKNFVKDSVLDIGKIKLLVNLDIVGTGSEGITIVNANKNTEVVNLITELNDQYGYFDSIQMRGEACNSDHCIFNKKGVPSIYIYTRGGVKAYHDVDDKAETLTLDKYSELVLMLMQLIEMP